MTPLEPNRLHQPQAASHEHGLARPRVVFLLGFPRCGSTVLGNTLGETPGFFHAGEVGYLWERHLLQGKRKCGCGRRAEECGLWSEILQAELAETAEVRAIVDWQHDLLRFGGVSVMLARAPLANPRVARYVERLEGLYSRIGAKLGCEVLIDGSKRPADGIAAGLLRERGWDVTFIHLVRNPIEVLYSRQRMKWIRSVGERSQLRRSIALRDSLAWSGCNILASLVRLRFGRRKSIQLKYEAFAKDPVPALSSIYRLMGVPKSPPLRGGGLVTMHRNHALGGNRNRFETGDVAIVLRERRGTLRAIDRFVASVALLPVGWLYGYGRPWR